MDSSDTGYKFNLALAVSDNLFNSDDLVELMVSYTPTSGSTYKSQIINETGAVLQDLGDAYYGNIHIINGNYKLFTFTVNPYTYNIYSLPGTLPCSQCNGTLGSERLTSKGNGGTISTPNPNPSTSETTINYTLPMDVSSGIITVVDAAGQMIKAIPVSSNTNSITLNNGNLSPGIYFYYLSVNGLNTASNKMVIVK